ncbi:MAG: 50S ribosomal protein L11 methyltransferase [Clostridiales bacterium]|nr:50S ribosomal protein L11 methyltransferase [Clostridiales bacterium]
MKWKKCTIETTTAAEDYLSAALMDLGIEGVEIEDNIPLSAEDQAEMFIDFLPELPPDDGVSHVSFYVEDDGSDQSALLYRVKASLEELRETVDIGSGMIESSETEDLDWINNWKQYFSTFTIDELVIKPTWEELPEEYQGRPMIEIDPGVSFGTGKHETTQLCIRQLVRLIRPADGNMEASGDAFVRRESVTEEGTALHKAMRAPRVLDLGCGSGILSIAALKLGAGEVVGTDLDADCITSTYDNLKVNHLEDADTQFYKGNLLDDEALREQVGGDYDIIVANILADVIIPLAPIAADMLKDGGYFITSGIIDFKEEAVCQAIRDAGLTILEVNHQGEWVGILAQRL